MVSDENWFFLSSHPDCQVFWSPHQKLGSILLPEFAAHKTIDHGVKQRGYCVGKDGQTTNNVENFFGNFKRGMKGTYRSVDDLAGQLAIVYRRPGPVRPCLFPRDGQPTVEITPPNRFRFDDLSAITEAAVGGAGFAWLPSWLVSEELRSGALVHLLRDEAAERGGDTRKFLGDAPTAILAWFRFLAAQGAVLPPGPFAVCGLQVYP